MQESDGHSTTVEIEAEALRMVVTQKNKLGYADVTFCGVAVEI